MVVLDRFFSFGRQKKWLLGALDMWLSYTVTIIWELAWVDTALVILDEFLFVLFLEAISMIQTLLFLEGIYASVVFWH